MNKAAARWAGKIILSTILLGWLAVTALLNHAEQINFLSRTVSSPWILKQYQADVPLTPEKGYRAGDVVFSEVERQLFADDVPILILQRPLIGAIALEHIYLLATDDSLIVLNKSPIEALEILAAGSGIPAHIQNIGLHYNEPVLQTRSGMWRGDFLLQHWELLTVEGVAWSQPEALPVHTHQALQHYLAGGIAIATVLADIRSGNIFAPYGFWLIDILLMVIALLLLRGLFGISGKAPD